MKHKFLLFFLLIFIESGCGQPFSYNSDLFNELKSMCDVDQEVRLKAIHSDRPVSDETVDEIQKIDAQHLRRLKKIMHQYGWPGITLVGAEGSEMAWLLVQHCDRDVKFQKKCFRLLKRAVFQGDASKRHLAFLMDRILVNEGLPQTFGTQIQIVDGTPKPYDVKDPINLEKRRREAGLDSLDEYLSSIKEVYQIKNNTSDCIAS